MSRKSSEIDPNSRETFLLGNHVFDVKTLQLQKVSGERVALRSQSSRVLVELLRRPGETVSKDDLMQAVWPDTFVTDDSLTQCISDIRRAIEDADHTIVQTVPKVGYLARAAVHRRGAADDPRHRRAFFIAPLVAACVATAMLGFLWLRHSPETALTPVRNLPTGPRIALVPFTNLSEDASDSFFSEGLTRDINSQLSRFSNLFVISPEAMTKYRGQVDCQTIRQELDADYILSGTVQRLDDQLRVTTAFTDAETCQQLATPGHFSEDLSLANLLDIQSQIAQRVASQVGSSNAPLFNASAQAKIRTKAPESLEAYECVLLGYWFYSSFKQAELDAARTCLERTVEAEPGYSHAWSRLALINMESKKYNLNPPQDWAKRARTAAEKAIFADRENADAHYALAALSRMTGEDIEVFLNHADRAIGLNANDSWILADLGTWLMYSGRWEKGQVWVEQARELNPHLHVGYNNPLHLYAIVRGDYDEAIKIMLEMGGRAHMNKASLIAAYAHNGQLEDANIWLDRLREEHPNFETDPSAPFRARGMPEALVDTILDGLALVGYPNPGR